jgi:hypothetical protein
MIGALISLISLDVTKKLVAAGVVFSTLSVVGASNVTPIVLTTSAPHRLVRPSHGVVAGVAGNANANGTWVLTPTGASTLRLSSYDAQGIPYAPSGSGSYTSGGTVKIAFPDGSILLGRRNMALATAVVSPRIVFVPVGSPVWELDPYGGVPMPATLPRARSSETAEQQAMMLQPQLITERSRFEVHVTGCSNPPDPDFGDFDATQSLYHMLYASMYKLISPARAKVLVGKWTSQGEDTQTTLLDSRGQKWVGVVEISQPVTESPLSFVPMSTVAEIIVSLPSAASADQTIIVVP